MDSKYYTTFISKLTLTVEREVVTPTFKLRRPVASKFFADVFHRLYEIEQSLLHQAKLRIAKL